MYRILLPIDENEHRIRAQTSAVLNLVRELTDPRVDILHVHEDRTEIDTAWTAGGFADEFEEAMQTLAESSDDLPEAVTTAAERIESTVVDCGIIEVDGDPAEAILSISAALESDQIFLGGKRHSRVGKFLFGSVAQDVILKSDRPVTVVPVAESDTT